MSTEPVQAAPGYFRYRRPEIAPMIPPGIKRMLDVGCGAGQFSFALKQERGIETWGVEINQAAAKEAATKLDHVIHDDAVNALARLPPRHFDLITFLDVLEHVAHPQHLLRSALPLLSLGGCVLLSLPNIRFWNAIRKIVLDGDFPQEDEGVFDRTHLRWYTAKSMPRLVQESGYEIVQMQGINGIRSRKLMALNILTRSRFEDCRFPQYAILARPAQECGMTIQTQR